MVDKDLSITRDEMLDELVEIITPKEPPGEGWRTVRQAQKAMGLTYDRTIYRLRRGHELGKLEKWEDEMSRRIYYRKVVKDD